MIHGDTKGSRTTEMLVLNALTRNGQIAGLKALADLSHRRVLNTGSEEASLVKDIAAATRELENKGIIKITKVEGTVLFDLTTSWRPSNNSKSIAQVPRAGKAATLARAGMVVGLVSTGALVAGCSYLKARKEPEVVYQPQPVRVATIVQDKADDGSTYWTSCSEDCPSPTRKTYAPVRPFEQAAPKLALKMEEELKSLYYLAFFKLGSAELGPFAKESIKQMIPEAKKAKNIVITGRTDETGPVVLNLDLAQKRAETVRDELVKAGVTAKIDIKTEIKPNSDLPQGALSAKVPDNKQAKARRTEVQIQVKQAKPAPDLKGKS